MSYSAKDTFEIANYMAHDSRMKGTWTFRNRSRFVT